MLAAAVMTAAFLTGPWAGASRPAARIVSLAPSLTEIAFAVGCGPKLVADTTYDNYPAAARSLPHVADLINADLERLSALHATAVIALHDQEREGGPIQSQLGIAVTYLPNRNLGDLFTDIAGVGDACGERARAAALSASLRARIRSVAKKNSARTTHPRVLVLLDLPGFTAGKQSFLNDLIRLAGGLNVAGDIKQAYPNLGSESILSADPDIIIVARAARFGSDITRLEPWRSLRAVKERRVLRPPSDDILERNGPRIVEGLEWLSRALHPK